MMTLSVFVVANLIGNPLMNPFNRETYIYKMKILYQRRGVVVSINPNGYSYAHAARNKWKAKVSG